MSDPTPTHRPSRPRSAVSNGVGLAGLFGVTIWLAVSLYYHLDGPWAALVNIVSCGVPMVLWSLLVDRVHRNPTTGIDWDEPAQPVRDTLDISLAKLAGLWATWAIIAALYCVFRFYWRGNYLFAMEVLAAAAIPLFILSIPYVIWIDTRLKQPRDGAWHLGILLMGQGGWDREAIFAHFRAWAVKGFFTAFMISIVPGGFHDLVNANFAVIQSDPLALSQWLITLMFVFDVCFATVGYLLTMKPLDSHIRSATPYAAGWASALICYPPFIMMGDSGPLDYHQQGAEWGHWLGAYPALLQANAILLVILTGIYAWATIAFGLRFSNLTDRGILTNGPYAFTKHPAYLSKNLFWWFAGLPFLTLSGSWIDAVRNTAILALVSCVYFWRAKTEERHLGADPNYQAYSGWMARYGAITCRLTPSHWFGPKPAPICELTTSSFR